MLIQRFVGSFFAIWIGLTMTTGCSSTSTNRPAFISKAEFDHLNSEARVTRVEAKDDLKSLVAILRDGYAGFYNGPVEKREQLLNDLALLASSVPAEVDPESFANSIDDIFYQFPDAHLAVRSFRDHPKRKRALGRRAPTVGLNIGQGKTGNLCYHFESRQIAGKNAAIFGIPNKFIPPTDPCWTGFDELVKKHKDDRMIIVDLRGNTGGNDAKGFDLASTLAGTKINAPAGFIRQVWLKTPTALDLHLNTQKWIINFAKSSGTPTQGYEDTLIKYEKETAERFGRSDFSPEIEVAPTDPSVGTNPNRKIFVLIDAKCGSSCESTLEALMSIPETITVGENTAGCRHYTNVGTYLLPNSRLNIQIPTKYNEYDRFLEYIGHSPDFRCPGKDALDYLIKSIERGAI